MNTIYVNYLPLLIKIYLWFQEIWPLQRVTWFNLITTLQAKGVCPSVLQGTVQNPFPFFETSLAPTAFNVLPNLHPQLKIKLLCVLFHVKSIPTQLKAPKKTKNKSSTNLTHKLLMSLRMNRLKQLFNNILVLITY